MNNRKGEKRYSLSSEVRNASMVKNKCEELQLEKKRRWLDKLRTYEKLDFMNKKKELLDLQLSIHSSKTDESRQGIKHQITSVGLPAWEDTFAQKTPLRSRTRSLQSVSHVVPPSIKTTNENHLQHRHARNSNSLGNLARKDYLAFSRFLPARSRMGDTTEATARNSHDNARAEEAISCQQKSVSKLFPPFYLQPLHKQKSKSLKDVSRSHLQKEPRLQTDTKEVISCYDLSNCRYLRS